MILMTMGDKDPLDLVLVFKKKGDVRDHKIYARHILLGKCHAAVDDYNAVVIAKSRHIHSYELDSAQRDDR
jgi:hypothetical protein